MTDLDTHYLNPNGLINKARNSVLEERKVALEESKVVLEESEVEKLVEE
jgi:hypothetical protein